MDDPKAPEVPHWELPPSWVPHECEEGPSHHQLHVLSIGLLWRLRLRTATQPNDCVILLGLPSVWLTSPWLAMNNQTLADSYLIFWGILKAALKNAVGPSYVSGMKRSPLTCSSILKKSDGLVYCERTQRAKMNEFPLSTGGCPSLLIIKTWHTHLNVWAKQTWKLSTQYL